MASKAQNVKLGIFLVATGVLAVLIIAYVGGRSLWQDRNVYYVESEETISGVDVESPVTMYGVRVGEVEAVELDREDFDSVTLILEIDEDVAVPQGAQAYMRNMGLTGLKQVDIAGGDLARGVQPPGTYIPRGQTELETLQQEVEDILPEIQKLVVHGDELLVRVGEIAGSVDPRQVDRIMDETESFVTELSTTNGMIQETLSETRPQVREILTNVKQASSRADDIIDRAEQATADVEVLVESTNEMVRDVNRMVDVNQDDLRATMYNLRRTSQNAEQLSRELREDPSRLLFAEPPEPRKLP